MANEQIGLGLTLTTGTTAIGNIVAITLPDQTLNFEDITDFDSDDWEVFLPTMFNAGELTFTVKYDGSAGGIANTLNTNFLAKTYTTWTATFSDTSTWACSGMISKLSAGKADSPKGVVKQDITIKMNEDPTYTDKAS